MLCYIYKALSKEYLYPLCFICSCLSLYEASALACEPSSFEKNTILDVTQNGTLILADRRQARLDTILLPFPPVGLQQYENWPMKIKAIEELKLLLVGKTVLLVQGDRKQDRYGRLLVQVFIENGEEKIWVQGRMIALGLAWAFPFQKKAHCMPKLLALEVKARAAKKGLWQHDIYKVQTSKKIYQLLRLTNSFQLVEGKVQKIAKVRGQFYLNFDQDWRTDFTVSISRKTLRDFKKMNKELQSYENSCVRVRGWIQQRNGPFVTITNPRQIEKISEC